MDRLQSFEEKSKLKMSRWVFRKKDGEARGETKSVGRLTHFTKNRPVRRRLRTAKKDASMEGHSPAHT